MNRWSIPGLGLCYTRIWQCSSRKRIIAPMLLALCILTFVFCFKALRTFIIPTDYIARSRMSFHSKMSLQKVLDGGTGHEVLEDIKSDDYLRRQYFNKYTELRQRQLLTAYPEKSSCLDEKSPAVPCYDTACNTPLSRDQNYSINSLLSTTRHARMTMLNPLQDVTANLKHAHLTIVAASSENHFLEVQGMIQSLHENVFPKFKNISFYFYDIGLTRHQLFQLQEYCRCKVINFPFHLMPGAISDIRCFTWKPLIVHAHLPKTDILIWADASVRFTSPENYDLFDDVMNKGLLAALPYRFFRPVAHNTALEMFRYFQVEPCSVAQFQELEANFLAFRNQPFIRDVIVETWAACALDPNCMCPEGTLKMHHCDFHVRKYAKCHRFDQSTMNLIMLKLFQENYSSFSFSQKYYAIKRANKVRYFDYLDEKENLRANRSKNG